MDAHVSNFGLVSMNKASLRHTALVVWLMLGVTGLAEDFIWYRESNRSFSWDESWTAPGGGWYSNWTPDGLSATPDYYPSSGDTVYLTDLAAFQFISLNGQQTAHRLVFFGSLPYRLTSGDLVLESGDLSASGGAAHNIYTPIFIEDSIADWNIHGDTEVAASSISHRRGANFNLWKRGGGALTVGHTTASDVFVSEGTLAVSEGEALKDATVWLTGQSVLDLTTHAVDAQLGALQGNADVHLGPQDLVIGLNQTDMDYTGTITGEGGLTKVGAGQISLHASGSSFGYLAVEGGVVDLANVTIPRLSVNNSVLHYANSVSAEDFQVGAGGVANIASGVLNELRVDAEGVASIESGTINRLHVDPGGTVAIRGGTLTEEFQFYTGSTVRISGGAMSHRFMRSPDPRSDPGPWPDPGPVFNGELEFIGGDFQLNGTPYSDGTLDGSSSTGYILTGTLADGSPFLLSRQAGSYPSGGSLIGAKLTTVELPPIDTTPIVVDGAGPPAPSGLRAGQSLTLREGGALGPNFTALDATLNLEGGQIDSNIQVARSEVNVSGGHLSERLVAHLGNTINISGGELAFGAGPGSTIRITGGTVRSGLTAESGSTVDVSGGVVRGGFGVDSGSTAQVSGGSIGGAFSAREGSAVTVTGGVFGEWFSTDAESVVEFIGGEFHLNGAPYTGSTITLAEDDLFTGVFADGSPFLFSYAALDRLRGVTLTAAALPAIDTTPIVVDAASPPAPKGLRAGQTLTVLEGGELAPHFSVIDATLNVEASRLDTLIEASGSELNLNGDVTDQPLKAYRGSTVNLTGGAIGPEVEVRYGSTLNLSGGTAVDLFASHGSTVNIAGGEVNAGNSRDGNALSLRDSDVNVTGGTVYDRLEARSGSDVTITGGRVFTVDIARGLLQIGGEASVSGVTAGYQSETTVSGGSTGIIDTSGKLTISDGELFSGFNAYRNSTVDITGGLIGSRSHGRVLVAHSGSTVNIFDGAIGGGFRARSGSVVTVIGGTVGDSFTTSSEATTIHGGLIGDRFGASHGSVVTITGGSFGTHFQVFDGGAVHLRGGAIEGTLEAYAGGTLHLWGTEFLLDGEPLDLTPGVATPITQRDQTLAGVLADGSVFGFQLNREHSYEQSFFDENATLLVTLLTEIPGDFNNDGLVDAADYSVWRDHVGRPAGALLNDFSGEAIGQTQYDAWAVNYGAVAPGLGAIGVPEPSCLALVSGWLALAACYRRS